MKSRFVIKTEKEIVGLNGIVIPPTSIETEVEYSLQEAAGMYELYKKIIKDLPEILENISKAVNFINAKRDQEKTKYDNCHYRNKESKKQCAQILSILNFDNDIYMVRSIDEDVIEVECANSLADIFEMIHKLSHTPIQYYLYIDSNGDMKAAINEYTNKNKTYCYNILNVISGVVTNVPPYIANIANKVKNSVKKY